MEFSFLLLATGALNFQVKQTFEAGKRDTTQQGTRLYQTIDLEVNMAA
jgi:hypothetical protein